MPRRLVKIETGQVKPSLQLVEFSQPMIQAYACLSYCWGTEKHAQTTRATLQQHIHGIEYEGLPRTIKDAIAVTKSLGLNYLWIDALCIIQDDEADK